MRQNHAQLVVIVDHLQQPAEDEDVAAGHDEGVHHRLVVDHRHRPVVALDLLDVLIAGQQLADDAAHPLRVRMLRRQQLALVRLNLLVELQLVQHLKLLRGEGDEAAPLGDRRLLDVREVVVGEGGEHQADAGQQLQPVPPNELQEDLPLVGRQLGPPVSKCSTEW